MWTFSAGLILILVMFVLTGICILPKNENTKFAQNHHLAHLYAHALRYTSMQISPAFVCNLAVYVGVRLCPSIGTCTFMCVTVVSSIVVWLGNLKF